MKDCSIQISAVYDDGGHVEDKKPLRCWSAYGAVENLIDYLKRINKESGTKHLRNLTIQLTLK